MTLPAPTEIEALAERLDDLAQENIVYFVARATMLSNAASALRAQSERIAELEALVREGADGFGRVMIATSDDKAVRAWQNRCRAALQEKADGVPS